MLRPSGRTKKDGLRVRRNDRPPDGYDHNRAADSGAKPGATGSIAPVGASDGELLALPRGIGHWSPLRFPGKPVGSGGSCEGLPAVAKSRLGKVGLTDARIGARFTP